MLNSKQKHTSAIGWRPLINLLYDYGEVERSPPLRALAIHFAQQMENRIEVAAALPSPLAPCLSVALLSFPVAPPCSAFNGPAVDHVRGLQCADMPTLAVEFRAQRVVVHGSSLPVPASESSISSDGSKNALVQKCSGTNSSTASC